jgi:hypothetical protein
MNLIQALQSMGFAVERTAERMETRQAGETIPAIGLVLENYDNRAGCRPSDIEANPELGSKKATKVFYIVEDVNFPERKTAELRIGRYIAQKKTG